MALPTVSYEWASTLVNLPNTSQLNRFPTTSTQKVQGIDFGQVPAVEEENYWRNAVQQWLDYIIAEGLVESSPIGSIKMHALENCPNGWLFCDGSALMAESPHSNLRTALIDDGYKYGSDGLGNPLLPDFRGYSPRGWDNGAGVDPGRVLGSVQADQNKSHNHTASSANAGSHDHGGVTGDDGGHNHTGTTSSNGSHSHFSISNVDGSGSGSYTNVSNVGGFDEAYALQSNSATTPTLGSTTTDGAHTHSFTTSSVTDHSHTISSESDHTHDITVDSNGGTEVRVKNLAVNFIIKY